MVDLSLALISETVGEEKDLSSMTSLRLNGLKLERLCSLAGFNLVELHLSDNCLSCLEPLSSLSNLFVLTVARNRLKTFPRFFKCLKVLDASYNSIETIDLPETATVVDLTGNPCQSLTKLPERNTRQEEHVSEEEIEIGRQAFRARVESKRAKMATARIEIRPSKFRPSSSKSQEDLVKERRAFADRVRAKLDGLYSHN